MACWESRLYALLYVKETHEGVCKNLLRIQSRRNAAVSQRISDWHTGSSIAIAPPYSAVFKPFLLPNFDALLDAFQTLLACGPSSLPMRRRDSNEDALLPYIDSPQPVCDSYIHKVMFSMDILRNGKEAAESKGCIGGIGQVGDRLGRERVAGTTYM